MTWGKGRSEKVMVDWAKLLSKERLQRETGREVQEVHVEQILDSTDSPALRIDVVMPSSMGTEVIAWELLEPVDQWLFTTVRKETDDLFPYIYFHTSADWAAICAGVYEE